MHHETTLIATIAVGLALAFGSRISSRTACGCHRSWATCLPGLRRPVHARLRRRRRHGRSSWPRSASSC